MEWAPRRMPTWSTSGSARRPLTATTSSLRRSTGFPRRPARCSSRLPVTAATSVRTPYTTGSRALPPRSSPSARASRRSSPARARPGGTYRLKPDLSAPGVNLLGARAGAREDDRTTRPRISNHLQPVRRQRAHHNACLTPASPVLGWLITPATAGRPTGLYLMRSADTLWRLGAGGAGAKDRFDVC